MESYDSEKESELGDQTSTSSIAAGGGSVRAASPTAAKNGNRNTNASSAGGEGGGGRGPGWGGAGGDGSLPTPGRLASSSLPPAAALDGQQPLGAKRGVAVVGDGSSLSSASADTKDLEAGASGGMDVLLEQLTGLQEAEHASSFDDGR